MQETNGRKLYNLVKSHELMSHFIRLYNVPSPSTALIICSLQETDLCIYYLVLLLFTSFRSIKRG